MKPQETNGYLNEFKIKMEQEKLPSIVIDTFSHYYRQILMGESGLLREKDIDPIEPQDLQHISNLKAFVDAGNKALKRSVMIVLNGGLGTSMGLSGPKSLLKIKNDFSFIDIILKQAERRGIKLCFMDSFSTHQETVSTISNLQPSHPPLYFLQHKYPKVLKDNFKPASWEKNPAMEWNPPGHGDVYLALYTSGLLDRLLEDGISYAFISNSDNLGGTLDPALLGYFSENNFPFMMEVSQRTPADVKGGHLAKHKDGRLVLREIAQCDETELNTFQDIGYHRFFNTNNIWINLVFLKELIDKDGSIQLPMILNPKTLDPRDDASPPIFQVETAMGSAISLFKGATAVQVPKTRLIPVKTCKDLLAVRSDCFIINDHNDLVLNPQRPFDVIKIDLDPAFYKKIDQFDERFPDGVPSLKDCKSLTVKGDVRFQGQVVIKGTVSISNKRSEQVVIEKGTILDKDVIF
jgi:UTP--glucose-1-phosphate uridylyltransferase